MSLIGIVSPEFHSEISLISISNICGDLDYNELWDGPGSSETNHGVDLGVAAVKDGEWFEAFLLKGEGAYDFRSVHSGTTEDD